MPYLKTLFQLSDYVASNDKMSREWWIWYYVGGSCHGLLQSIITGCVRRVSEKPRNTSARQAGLEAEIWNRNLQNTKQEYWYWYDSAKRISNIPPGNLVPIAHLGPTTLTIWATASLVTSCCVWPTRVLTLSNGRYSKPFWGGSESHFITRPEPSRAIHNSLSGIRNRERST